MKVCLVNIKNCIDYSQYGQFLFEYIKSGDCVIYNSVNDSNKLNEIYENILSEYNRNSFVNGNIRLLFFIPRDIKAIDVADFEFYNDINIYMHIISKMNIFTEISTIYIDDNCENCTQGEEHRYIKEVSEKFYSSDTMFEEYLPLFQKELENKSDIKKSVQNIANPTFKSFFEEVLKEIPDELDEVYSKQLKNIFSSKCAGKLPNIIKKYVFINTHDIADNIIKTINIVYFIRSLIENPNSNMNDFDDFSVDLRTIKQIISTYKKRLDKWLNSSFSKEYPEVDTIKVFEKQNNVQEFICNIDAIINVQLAELDNIKTDSFDVVKIVFDKLESIVKNADDEMQRFVHKDIKAYYDDDNYTKETINNVKKVKQDAEKYDKELTEELNQYSKITLPGFTEQLRLEQRLENANKQIEELLKCKREYSFKTFFATLLFSGVSVVLLYLIAQCSVFVKEHSFMIFSAYSIVILVSFFSVFGAMSLNYKHKIGKLLKICKKEVAEFLRNYKIMAEEFEKNLNLMAEYACLKEYLDKKKYIDLLRKNDIKKYNWHKRKVREILDNLCHFNDFVKDTESLKETEDVEFVDFSNDAEHTEFYQMKIF